MDSIQEQEPSDVLTPDTENATYFDPHEADPPKFAHDGRTLNYKRLRLYNRNTWTDRREENKEVTHRRDNLAILDAVASQLDLTPFQKDESRRTFDQLELGEIGKEARLVAFGVCVVVANRDIHDGSRYHPQMDGPDELFVEFVNDQDFSESQIHSILGYLNNLSHV